MTPLRVVRSTRKSTVGVAMRDEIRQAIDEMPSFYEHEFGEWKYLLANRLEKALEAALSTLLDTPGLAKPPARRAFLKSLRDEP